MDHNERINRLATAQIVHSAILHALIWTHPAPAELLKAFLTHRQLAEDLAVNSQGGEQELKDLKKQFGAFEKMIRARLQA